MQILIIVSTAISVIIISSIIGSLIKRFNINKTHLAILWILGFLIVFIVAITDNKSTALVVIGIIIWGFSSFGFFYINFMGGDIKKSEPKWMKQNSLLEKLNTLYEKSKLEFEQNLTKHKKDLQMLSKLHYNFARKCDHKFWSYAKKYTHSTGYIFTDSHFPFLAEANKEFEWIIANSTNNQHKKDAEKHLKNIITSINEMHNNARSAIKALSRGKGEKGLNVKDYLSRIEVSFPELKTKDF